MKTGLHFPFLVSSFIGEKYEMYKRKFPDHLLTKLKDFFASLFDCILLKDELVNYSSPEFADKNVHELEEFITKKGLCSGSQEAFLWAELIVTIPSNVASVPCCLEVSKACVIT